jgi:hypothetical protein
MGADLRPREEIRMIGRSAALVLLSCMWLLLAAGAAPAQELVHITRAGFSPDLLGMPTDAFGSATIESSDLPVPSPITHVEVLGPAGVSLYLEGSATCSQSQLERVGPTACPADSRAGVGGGDGVYVIGKEIVHEQYELEFFLADNRPGHVALLVYLTGHQPVSIELVFPARAIQAPRPYGLGFSLEVPLIKVLPEASNASAMSAFLDLGAKGQTYTKLVHGKGRRLHIRGIVLPHRCPRGGWPVASRINFLDGTSVMATRSIPCPR